MNKPRHSLLQASLLVAWLLLSAGAQAKLPPLNDEAKAKAAETAAKTAWTNKLADFQLCKVMDRVAAAYRANAKTAGKEAPPAVETPACTDPGPFAYTPPETKPIEASGAHSPPQTATAPPSTTTPAAAASGAK